MKTLFTQLLLAGGVLLAHAGHAQQAPPTALTQAPAIAHPTAASAAGTVRTTLADGTVAELTKAADGSLRIDKVSADAARPKASTRTGSTTASLGANAVAAAPISINAPATLYFVPGQTTTLPGISISGDPALVVSTYYSMPYQPNDNTISLPLVSSGFTAPGLGIVGFSLVYNNRVLADFRFNAAATQTTPTTLTISLDTYDNSSVQTTVQLVPVACLAPINVAVGSVTATTASVSFTSLSTAANGYTVTYTPDGGSARSVSATTSPVTLTGLTPNTPYTVTVTSNCDAGATAAAPATSFTTTCTAPVFTAAPDVTALSGSSDCGARVSLAATATGNPAPGITYALNGQPIAATSSFPVGTFVVTATAANACGTTSRTFSVTVLDNIKPTITAPAAVRVGTDAGQCSASTVALGTPTTADNCQVADVRNDAPTTFPLGTTTVTWTVTDNSGNTATATQLVTVADTEKPVLNAQNNLTVNAPATACGAVVSFSPTATDNCTGATVTTSPASGSTFSVGTTTVNVTATDASGNQRTGSFLVTVNDVTSPVVRTKPATVTLMNGAASITAAQVNDGSSDNCSGTLTYSVSPNTFSCANIGSNNTVTLTVTDASGNKSTGTATVTVMGTIPTPTISVTPANSTYTGGVATTLYLGYGPQSATLTASGGVSYQWSPATGLSNATIANPVFTATKAGTFTYTVTATSASGCTATKSVTLTVIDARCSSNGNRLDKVMVCHSGNTLCINSADVIDHLNHGDKLGACIGKAQTASLASAAALAVDSEARTNLEAYPNPFTSRTTFRFQAAQAGAVQLQVYNALGQLVATLYNGPVQSGEVLERTLDGANLSTGLYTCRFATEGQTLTQRVVLSK